MQEYRGKLREVEEVDDAVDRLIDALVETNQLGRTWIFFLTDNGFQHGEHFLDKKLWPYEESARTPFVVRGPGVPAGTTNKHLVSQVDLLPTICEIAGADASDVDGRSLLPVLRDPAAPFREFLLVEAEERGWHSIRMRRRSQPGQTTKTSSSSSGGTASKRSTTTKTTRTSTMALRHPSRATKRGHAPREAPRHARGRRRSLPGAGSRLADLFTRARGGGPL
jgi:arylsulfatase A-like enzyme